VPPLIRRTLVFESFSQVITRAVILMTCIAISAGLILNWTIHSFFAGDLATFAANATLSGVIIGAIVSGPVVFAYFFAARKIYRDNQGVAKAESEEFVNALLNRREFFMRINELPIDRTVRAVAMIEVTGDHAPGVVPTLRQIPEIVLLHTTNGAFDLVAEIEALDMVEFGKVLTRVRSIDGVSRFDTNMLLAPA
jgi:DNA-binding Lrp family transcriptional regulator